MQQKTSGNSVYQNKNFMLKPPFEADYATTTWRNIQSAIDILQNHLDANTTVYEKELLACIGVHSYHPKSDKQTKVVNILKELRKCRSSEEKNETYSKLKEELGEKFKLSASSTELADKLSKITYQTPEIRFRVVENNKTKWKTAEQLSKLPSTVKISGIRVYDQGSGFDYKLLKTVGTSNKNENKRGGLGEGLKVSILHLLREKAQVRLISKNFKGVWLAEPSIKVEKETEKLSWKTKFLNIFRKEKIKPEVKIVDKEFAISGKTKPNAQANEFSGSITEITLEDSNLIDAYSEMFDPRSGHGICKYVLDFDPDYCDRIDQDLIVDKYKGVIYVKGLYIEEKSDLLFSYNLGDKMAIAGRDRKNVDRTALEQAIPELLAGIRSKDEILSILLAIMSGENCQEIEHLNDTFFCKLDDQQKQQWKECIEQAFNYKHGECLFADKSERSGEKFTKALEKGYSIIFIEHNKAEALKRFFKGLIQSDSKIDQSIPVILNDIHVSQSSAIKENKTELQKEEIKRERILVPDKLKSEFEKHRLELIAEIENTSDELNKEQKKLLRKLNNFSIEDDAIYIEDYDFRYIYSEDAAILQISKEFVKYFEENELTEKDHTKMKVALISCLDITRIYKGNCQSYITRLLGINSEFIPNLDSITEECSSIETIISFGNENNYSEEKQDKAKEKLLNTIEDLPLDQQIVQINEFLVSNQVFYADIRDFIKISKYVLHQGNFCKIENDSVQYGNDKQICQFKLTQIQESFRDTPLYRKLENEADKLYNSLHGKLYLVPSFAKNFSSKLQMSSKTLRDNYLKKQLKRIQKFTNFVSSDNPQIHTAKHGESIIYGGYDNIIRIDKLLQNQNYPQIIKLKDQKNSLCCEIQIKKINGNVSFELVNPNGANKIFFPGDDTYLSDSLSTSISFTQDAIVLRTNDVASLSVTEQAVEQKETKEEENYGKEHIKSDINLVYGKKVWDNPVRILLDAIQNHKDANRGNPLTFEFTMLDHESRKIFKVTPEQLKKCNSKQEIVGISIQDQGSGYTTPHMLSFGSSTKGDEDIGKFGEGLKMLAVSCERQGIHLSLNSRNFQAQTTKHVLEDLDDFESNDSEQDDSENNILELEEKTTDEYLAYKVKWQDQERTGSETAFSILELQEGQAELSEEEYNAFLESQSSETFNKVWKAWQDMFDGRNLVALAAAEKILNVISDRFSKTKLEFKTDESINGLSDLVALPKISPLFYSDFDGSTMYHETLEYPYKKTEVTPKGIDAYVLRSAPLDSNGFVNVHTCTDGGIYEKSLLILNSTSDEYSYGNYALAYDFQFSVITTRERNAYDEKIVDAALKNYYANLKDISVMEAILRKAAQNPNKSFKEFDFIKLNQGNQHLWRQAYYNTFGNTAILSLASIDGNRDLKSQYSEKRNMFEFRVMENARNIQAVVNEQHLSNTNLIKLPSELTSLFSYTVFTSQDFTNRLEAHSFPLTESANELLDDTVREINERVIDGLKSLKEEYPEKYRFLEEIINQNTPGRSLDSKLKTLESFSSDNTSIKHVRFAAHGQYKFNEKTGKHHVDMREDLLSKPEDFVAIYIHEIAHFLSDEKDYTENFNIFMYTMAEALKLSGRASTVVSADQ